VFLRTPGAIKLVLIMAILSECPGLEVQVLAQSRHMQEYNEDEEDPSPKAVSKFVEAQSGVNFSVDATFKPLFSAQYDV
jgi:hypothetical protein